MNYQEHKEFFDGRRSKKAQHRNYKDKTRVTMDGDNVVLTYHGWKDRVICKIVVRPDDHFYIHMPDWSQGGLMRIEKLTGVKLTSYKQETIKESRRIWLNNTCYWTIGGGVSVPWIDGVLYYGTQPVDLEKHVDYKRGFDPEKRLEIQRKIRDLSKAARVLAVMDAYDMPAGNPYRGNDYAYEHEIAMLNRDGVTGALAEAVCASAVKAAKQDWYYNRPAYGSIPAPTDADRKKKRLSAVKNAMEKFTKALYAQAGAYVWTEVKP